MKMNDAIKMLAVGGMLCAAFAASGAAPGESQRTGRIDLSKMTPEQRQAFRERARRHLYEKTGGFIRKPDTGSGMIAFCNLQRTVPGKDIAEPPETLSRVMAQNIVSMDDDWTFSVEGASGKKDALGANVALFIADVPNLPMSIVAAEAGWGLVNVAALKRDNPMPFLLAQRTRREMWRVFAMMCGASNSSNPQCIMQSVTTAGDIDALVADSFSPEPMNKVVAHLAKIGMKPFEHTSYKRACEEGWAPAPTNDVQKAIWDKVHQLPTEPIKIKPETKKVKE